MKSLLITFLILLSSSVLWGQSNHLSGLHGLKNDQGDIFLEIAGYDIAIYTEKGSIDNPQTMAAIKKSFSMDHILIEGSKPSINIKNKVLEATTAPYSASGINIYQICVCLQEDKDKITIIYFETFNYRDDALEKEVINAYLEDKLSPYITPNWKTTSVDFAGKLVTFDHFVEWIKPHELSYQTAQIKWSEFSSKNKAESNRQRQIIFDKADRVDILSDETVPVYIENKKVSARRIIYKDLSSYSSAPLVVYYLTHEMNLRYISCVLSYITDESKFELPPFFKEFVQITPPADFIEKNADTSTQNLQENYLSEKSTKNQLAHRKQGKESEKKTSTKKKTSVSKAVPINRYLFEIQAGLWEPLGDWQYFNSSFSWAFYVGIPLKKKGVIDLGVGITHLNHPPLIYYPDDKLDIDEVQFMGNIMLRYRHHCRISLNSYFIPYIGGEWSYIETEVDFKNMVHIFGGFAGFSFTYKKMGLFAEYHYTPFKMSGKIQENFHSSLRLGASLSFYSY